MKLTSFKKYIEEFPLRSSSMMPIQSFAQYCSEMVNKLKIDDEYESRVAPDLNIWKETSLGKNEVRHCSVLAWLLNPLGSHAQKGLFASILFRKLKLLEIERLCEEEFQVTTEGGLGDGRIDITLSGSFFIVGIEVKIDAGLGPNQLSRYMNALRSRGITRNIPSKQVKLIYLTISGEKSMSETDHLSCSWRQIAECLEEFSQKAKPLFLKQATAQLSACIIDNCYKGKKNG